MSFKTIYATLNNLDKDIKKVSKEIKVYAELSNLDQDAKRSIQSYDRELSLLQDHAHETDTEIKRMNQKLNSSLTSLALRMATLEAHPCEANSKTANLTSRLATLESHAENTAVGITITANRIKELEDKARSSKDKGPCECAKLSRLGLSWSKEEERLLRNTFENCLTRANRNHKRTPRALAIRLRDHLLNNIIDEI